GDGAGGEVVVSRCRGVRVPRDDGDVEQGGAGAAGLFLLLVLHHRLAGGFVVGTDPDPVLLRLGVPLVAGAGRAHDRAAAAVGVGGWDVVLVDRDAHHVPGPHHGAVRHGFGVRELGVGAGHHHADRAGGGAGGVGDLVGDGHRLLADGRSRFGLDADEVVVDHGGLQTAALGHVDAVDHEDAAGGVDIVLERVQEGAAAGGDGAHVVHGHRGQVLGLGLDHVHAHQAEGGGARAARGDRVLEVVGAGTLAGDVEGPSLQHRLDLEALGVADADQLEVAAVGIQIVDERFDGGAAPGDDAGMVGGGDRGEV